MLFFRASCMINCRWMNSSSSWLRCLSFSSWLCSLCSEKSDKRDLTKRSKAALRAASPLTSAITGELSSCDSEYPEYDDLGDLQAQKAQQITMIASAVSLTRIVVFVRAGMTQILRPNCTPRPVRPQGGMTGHRDAADTETRRRGDKETGRQKQACFCPYLLLPVPRRLVPVSGGAMISAAGSESRRAW